MSVVALVLANPREGMVAVAVLAVLLVLCALAGGLLGWSMFGVLVGTSGGLALTR